MYSISSTKLNSAFSTIGKATAEKITAKLVGKNSRFRFCMNSNLTWLNRVMQDHEARASDLNRKSIFSFFLLFS